MTAKQLAKVLADIVQYSRNDYFDGKSEDSYPEDTVGWNCAYVCACFLANNTKYGNNGVDTEFPFTQLQIDKSMSYESRLALAEDAVKFFNMDGNY